MMDNQSSTGTRSSEDIIKQFQVHLRKYENDDKLVILEAIEKSGSNPGDNYMSVMIRTKVIGTRGNGSPYTKSFMMKNPIRDKKVTEFADISQLFRTEGLFYSKISPILGSFGPRCIYADEEIIIMEDLAERGYVTYERRNFLDLNHTISVLKLLAKLHALALAVKIHKPQQFDMLSIHLEEAIYKKSEKSAMKSYTESYMKSAEQYLDMIEPHTQELQTIKDHIATYSDKLYDIFCLLFNAPKQKYDTICHGDPWINNILFLHDNGGRIIDLKMVDYQIIRHTSIATDIIYFIYSSVQSSLIEKSFESLIKIYHNEFLNELRQSHVDEKFLEEVGMEWLNKELRTYASYALAVGCSFVHPILADEQEIQQFFDNMDFSEVNLAPDMSLTSTQKKLDRIKCVVFHYYRRLHLGIINEDIEPISVSR